MSHEYLIPDGPQAGKRFAVGGRTEHNGQPAAYGWIGQRRATVLLGPTRADLEALLDELDRARAERAKTECAAGCSYGMNSSCLIQSREDCGCEVHLKSVYFGDRGWVPGNPHRVPCPQHDQAAQDLARARKNGLCPKCETYCYGDCESN